jgi:hypothetical protein
VEFNEQWRNKYTSLKAAFRSTDSTKHFHGTHQQKFEPTTDYPEVSEPQLIPKSVDDNIPVKPKKFKQKLLSTYNENDTSTRQYTRGQTARYSDIGIKLYSRNTNKHIKNLDDKLSRKEYELTGNDSQKHINDVSKDVINRQHQLNAIKPKSTTPSASQFSKNNKKISSEPSKRTIPVSNTSKPKPNVQSSASQFSHQQNSSEINKPISPNSTQHQSFKNKLINHYRNNLRKY